MKSSQLVTWVRWLVYATVAITPLFYLRQGVYPYALSKTAFFQGGVEAAFCLWLALIYVDKRYRIRLTPVVWGLGAFFVALVLTAAFGVDPWRSFWSTQERALGVVTFLHFGALALIISSLRDEIKPKVLLFISTATAIFVIFLAFLQLFVPDLLLKESVGDRPGATFGNPSFLAGYLSLHIFWLFYYLVSPNEQSRNRTMRVLTWGALAILILGVFQAQTRGDLVGLGVGFFALLAYFFFFPLQSSYGFLKSRSTYVAIFLLGLLFLGLFWTTRTNDVWAGIPGIQRFRGLDLASEDLRPRILALEAAWAGFLERPVFGWGWDNFNIVFNKHYNPENLSFGYKETRFDKPHNFILENLVVGGVTLMLCFIFFLATIFYAVWKKQDSLWAGVLSAAILAYVVRNAFIFETVGPLLIFFVLIGLIDGKWQPAVGAASSNKPKYAPPSVMPAFLVASGVALTVVYFANVLVLQASYYQFRGFNLFIQRKPIQAIQNFRRAVEMPTPYAWTMTRDYVATVAENYFYTPDRIPVEEVKLAVQAMEQVARDHPLDAYNHYFLVDVYNQVSGVNKEEYLAKAEKEAAIALELSPNRQQILFSLAKTKSLQGDEAGALAVAKQGRDLNPNVPDGHFYYGLLAYVAGEKEIGYTELRAAIDLGRHWKNFHEPLVVGNFFADSGHLGEAIQLYEQARDLEPTDLEVRIKLATAYYFHGDRALARTEIEEIMKKTDVTQAIGFNEIRPILRDLGFSY